MSTTEARASHTTVAVGDATSDGVSIVHFNFPNMNDLIGPAFDRLYLQTLGVGRSRQVSIGPPAQHDFEGRRQRVEHPADLKRCFSRSFS